MAPWGSYAGIKKPHVYCVDSPFAGLLPVSYDGIGPLPLANFSDSGNTQSLARYSFPHRDGQDAEQMGRAPLLFAAEIQFFTSIAKDLYPKRYIELKRRVAQPGGGYLVHPTEGQVWGFITQFNATHRPDERNGCRVQITFEEVSDATEARGTDTLDSFATAEHNAAAADAGLAALGVPSRPQTLTQDVASWRDKVATPDLSAAQLSGDLAEFQQQIAEMLDLDALQDVRNSEIFQAIRAVGCGVADAVELAASLATQIIEAPALDADRGPIELAVEWYGDAERASDIITLNPPRFFFYPRGTVLLIPDR